MYKTFNELRSYRSLEILIQMCCFEKIVTTTPLPPLLLDVPKEISNPEILADCLPIAKATIHETCTLVAVTRVRSHHILIPTNRSYTFSKQYGKNAQLKITFPAGVTNDILILTVQVFVFYKGPGSYCG